MNELINLEKYCLITFSSTAHALKAEKIMKEKEREFLLVPTLREISSSCGLSLKIKPEHFMPYLQELLDKKVLPDGIYSVSIREKKISIEKIDVPGKA